MAPVDQSHLPSVIRARNVLAVLALVAPVGLMTLFERQARRLDALAERGEAVTAVVTKVRRGTTHYAYQAAGKQHDWSVRTSEAPNVVGTRFVVVYLPGDEGLSRPTADRSAAAAEAANNRHTTWKYAVGAAWFFAGFAMLAQQGVARLRGGGEATPEKDTRARLAGVGVVILPLLAPITGFHASDALARGESLIPVVLATILILVIIGATVRHTLRDGADRAGHRAQAVIRKLAPLAALLAIVRLIALWLAP